MGADCVCYVGGMTDETSPLPQPAYLRDAFSFLENGEDRLTYLIELVQKLPEFPSSLRHDGHLVKGCVSRIWMDHAWDNQDRLNLHLAGESAIVRGLLTILMTVYQQKSATEILSVQARTFLADLGLAGELGVNRQNGFAAVNQRIQHLAKLRIS